MRRAGFTLVVLAFALALGAPAAHAADECRGLQSCIPVAGPWVVIPAPAAVGEYPTTLYELRCPRRAGTIGGLDARVSDPAIDLAFIGNLGSPVAPGVTTSNAAVFVGTYTGLVRRPTTFRPFLGCIPSAGGRSQTALTASPPGRPTVRRVRALRLRPGARLSAVHGCRRGERLVSSSHAIAFWTSREPSGSLLASVEASSVDRGGRVAVRAAATAPLPQALRIEVQVHAVCARRGRP